MKLTEEEMIKIYACLAFCYHDLEHGFDAGFLGVRHVLQPGLDDNSELEKLMMKFYCEIKNEKILDKIDDAIEVLKKMRMTNF